MTKRLSLFFLCFLSIVSADLSSDDEAFFEVIYEEHVQLLPYIDESNPKLMVMFLATPGMGKTSISKTMEEHFHALRLSRDEAREILARHGVWSSYCEKDEAIVHRYFTWLLIKLSQCSPNHFFILDCKCNKKYAEYCKFCEEHNFDPFLIRIDVERDIVEARIRSRGKTVDDLLQDLDGEWRHYEQFGRDHTPDYVFYNGKDFEGPMTDLLLCLPEAFVAQQKGV